MTDFVKHRGRHKWGVLGGTGEGDTNYSGCVKCGKPKPEVVIPPAPEPETPAA